MKLLPYWPIENAVYLLENATTMHERVTAMGQLARWLHDEPCFNTEDAMLNHWFETEPEYEYCDGFPTPARCLPCDHTGLYTELTE